MQVMEERTLKKNALRYNEYYNMQDIFDDLYRKSKEGKIFKDLYSIIVSEENIQLAYRNIKRNRGSHTAGTNHRTLEYWEDVPMEKFIIYIQSRLQYYIPQKVRRVEIPKPDGRKRPLGIPCIEDRIIQQCIKQVMEPVCEAKFHPYSFGFRPNRGTEHAIAYLYKQIQIDKRFHIVDIDIKGFFDNVNHSKLIKQIWTMGIHDKKLLSILKTMLKAEIEGIGIPTKGVPQGGILSPLLSNIVLNELDWWISNQWQTFEKTKHEYSTLGSKHRALKNTNLKEIYIVRYADDFKIICRKSKDAEKIFHATQQWLKERLGLEINPEKSKITNVKENYTEFLGYKIKAHKKKKKYVVKSKLTKKARKNVQKKIKAQVKVGQKHPTVKEIYKLNRIIAGEHNYYAYATLVNIDFGKINYNLSKCLETRLKDLAPKKKKQKGKRNKTEKKGYKTREYLKKYDEYKGRPRIISGIYMYPIYGVTTKTPLLLKQEICNYTPEGRKIIHNELGCINKDILNYLLANPSERQSIEFNDNRLSKYVAQKGMCPISGLPLDINMQVHHIKPKQEDGTDEYNNLIILSYEVHKLVHATKQETIEKYLNMVKLDDKAIKKLNKLRKSVGNTVVLNDD